MLKLLKNLYGQKQASHVWNQHLTVHLTTLRFIQSKVDECVFYFKCSIFLVFTDEMMILGPCPKELDHMINLLKTTFKIQDEGALTDYLGIKLEHTMNKLIMTQPHLIASILHDLHLDQQKSKTTSSSNL